MANKIKYVKVSSGEVIMFPAIIEHDVFKYLNPVSAGFCNIKEDHIDCFGESYSLKLKSDPKQDSLDATRHFFGIEAMIKIM